MIKRFADATVNCLGNAECSTGLPTVGANNNSLQIILQLTFGIIGAVAVIIIIIAGLQLVTSGGQPDAAAKARRTIIYAVIGLIVAVSAEIIVGFVLNGFK